MKINASIVFEKNYDALASDKRFIINQGSSRSSKTYSICQLLIIYSLQNPNKVISIVRKTFPTLRATVLRDFFEILKEMELYERNNHNKTENIYTFPNGTIIEFFSTDDEQKLRGRKRDIGWINESNELFYDDFNQLNLRTTDKLILDYNPSDANSWIYELPEEDSIIIKSTYKDNPFLEDNIIKQIENLKNTDAALWSIYGLGERATSRKNIYSNWTFLDSKPDRFVQYMYGLDFGFNHPTSLVKVYFFEDELFIETLIYESYLTTTDLIERMKELNIDTNTEIMADYARPEIIAEISLANYNVQNAKKSVKKGIDNVKTFRVYGLQSDKSLIKEYENYMWKKVGDQIIDEPVKLYDDSMDAIRYCVYNIKDLFYNDSPMLSF